ncbi:glycosyltransferase [Synechococcus sp. CB0205]|uniref:glycosyltransferase n=1 Tax=Synechococcus sp. CB0205 TaxID=232363 RepID=UPI0002002282|nr:glycosyltransferase [Synechococcus sp. CB0205]
MAATSPSALTQRLLFIHQNFPGQFKHLAPALQRLGYDVRALYHHSASSAPFRTISGIPVESWSPQRGTTLQAHPWAHDYETKLIRAHCVAEQAERLRNQGWTPDLIIGHPGWGELLFLKQIWPDVPQLHFLEFFYRAQGLDVGFDPEFSALSKWQEQARVHSKSAAALMGLEEMAAGLSPTHFQAQTYPQWCQQRIRVIHDGIDTALLSPDPQASLSLSGIRRITLTHDQPVLTFVNRNLEPYRGYHRLMRSLPEIQRLCPNLITVIVGGDGVSYGAAAPEGKTWKSIFLDEVATELDLDRLFFVGNTSYDVYRRLLQVSSCHVYYTYPFVLGWSCLEALSTGCVVVGSDTEPVREVIEHENNGLLVDFFDQDRLTSSVVSVIQSPERFASMRHRARASVVSGYDLKTHCLPAQIELVKSLFDS